MKFCGSVCTDLPHLWLHITQKKSLSGKGQRIANIRKTAILYFINDEIFAFFVIMDVPVAKLMLRSQNWEQILKSGSGSGIESPWGSKWEIS